MSGFKSIKDIRKSFRDKERQEAPPVAVKPTGVTVHSSVSKPEPTEPTPTPTPQIQSTPTQTGKKKVTEMEKARTNYVGFANLPNQVFRKAVKKGFQFSLMVAGQSGLGKSTLVNSLFLSSLYEDSVYNTSSIRLPQTTEVKESTVHVEENGVKLELTLVDSPGFGELVDNSQCWDPILNHIDSQYESYLNQESRVTRERVNDRRVHCCLYFIAPNGHGLKALDIEFMKKLHNKVNIIPVIAKADTLTPNELTVLKKKVFLEIQDHGIQIFVPDLFEDDEASNTEVKEIRTGIPFAVVGSNTLLEVNGKKVRGRIYPWGVVEVENKKHSDFVLLRDMMMKTHMQDLKDITQDIHYENYRKKKLIEGENGVVVQEPIEGSPPKKENLEKQLAEMQEKMARLMAKLSEKEKHNEAAV